MAMERERGRRWRERHPGAGAAASRKHRAKVGCTPWPAQRATGQRIRLLKETTPCADCHRTYPFCCMDFDHREGTVKSYNVGSMVAHGYSIDLIMTEIAKCDLVCANCHRIRTQARRIGKKRNELLRKSA